MRFANLLPAALIITGCLLFAVLSVSFTLWAVANSNHHFCATLTLLDSQQPPGGNPAHNPSRAYLQHMHDDFVRLHHDLGCGA